MGGSARGRARAGAGAGGEDVAAWDRVARTGGWQDPAGRGAGGWLVSAVHGDHAGAAEAQVVLECDLRAFDLARTAQAAELLVELEALGEAGSPERVALGEQAAGWVHDPVAAVGGPVLVDEAAALAFLAQAERFVGD